MQWCCSSNSHYRVVQEPTWNRRNRFSGPKVSKFHFARLTRSHPPNTSVFLLRLSHPCTPPFLARPRPFLARSLPGPRPASPGPHPTSPAIVSSNLAVKTGNREIYQQLKKGVLRRALFCVFLCSEVVFSCKSHQCRHFLENPLAKNPKTQLLNLLPKVGPEPFFLEAKLAEPSLAVCTETRKTFSQRSHRNWDPDCLVQGSRIPGSSRTSIREGASSLSGQGLRRVPKKSLALEQPRLGPVQPSGCPGARDAFETLRPSPENTPKDLAPSLIEFRGSPRIRALYQAIGIPTQEPKTRTARTFPSPQTVRATQYLMLKQLCEVTAFPF